MKGVVAPVIALVLPAFFFPFFFFWVALITPSPFSLPCIRGNTLTFPLLFCLLLLPPEQLFVYPFAARIGVLFLVPHLNVLVQGACPSVTNLVHHACSLMVTFDVFHCREGRLIVRLLGPSHIPTFPLF